MVLISVPDLVIYNNNLDSSFPSNYSQCIIWSSVISCRLSMKLHQVSRVLKEWLLSKRARWITSFRLFPASQSGDAAWSCVLVCSVWLRVGRNKMVFCISIEVSSSPLAGDSEITYKPAQFYEHFQPRRIQKHQQKGAAVTPIFNGVCGSPEIKK